MSDETTRVSRSYDEALGMARAARSEFIALTHRLPKEAPQAVLRLWNEADNKMFEFIRELESRS